MPSAAHARCTSSRAGGVTEPEMARPGTRLTDTQENRVATLNGTIKRLNPKGFGFIAASDGNEYFFHSSACSQIRFEDLHEGQPVTFERGQGPKGPRGENVRIAE